MKPVRPMPADIARKASPSGNGGRGLKPSFAATTNGGVGIALWKRRAWIETCRVISPREFEVRHRPLETEGVD